MAIERRHDLGARPERYLANSKEDDAGRENNPAEKKDAGTASLIMLGAIADSGNRTHAHDEFRRRCDDGSC